MHRLLLLLSLISATFLLSPSMAAVDTFVYGGCSQTKYSPWSSYDSNLNSLLTSIVNSASLSLYNNYSVNFGDSSLFGLFQCRGDVATSACFRCVSDAVSQLGSLCVDSTGGVIQLDGCLVKYDNTSFLGVEDNTLVLKKCGSPVALDASEMSRRDADLDYLVGGYSDDSGFTSYRIGGTGDVYAVSQCVQDLGSKKCRDCLTEAIGRLKTECGVSSWGDMYLGKCYVRFDTGGRHANLGHGGGDGNSNDSELQKTMAILIGLIAGVVLLVVFLSCLRNVCQKAKGGSK